MTKSFRLPYLSRGGLVADPPSLNLFFDNLNTEVWTELGKKASGEDHALSGGKSFVKV